MPQLSLASPLGDLTLFEENDALVALDWGRGADTSTSPLLREAVAQLDAYFAGELQRFDLPLSPLGTAFQRSVWQLMAQIPYGTVQRYGELARRLATAPRAVGSACGRNPLPILIPCHRVVRQGGGLGGYSGMDGVETKRFLLRLEGCTLAA